MERDNSSGADASFETPTWMGRKRARVYEQ